mmetsp:Transcript_21346/g.66168  ORF Transcript_21346/g.66168 Transcript_21346/m.66168 type:complete len:268 (-) Transcript_21346:3942-4745(-)
MVRHELVQITVLHAIHLQGLAQYEVLCCLPAHLVLFLAALNDVHVCEHAGTHLVREAQVVGALGAGAQRHLANGLLAQPLDGFVARAVAEKRVRDAARDELRLLLDPCRPPHVSHSLLRGPVPIEAVRQLGLKRSLECLVVVNVGRSASELHLEVFHVDLTHAAHHRLAHLQLALLDRLHLVARHIVPPDHACHHLMTKVHLGKAVRQVFDHALHHATILKRLPLVSKLQLEQLARAVCRSLPGVAEGRAQLAVGPRELRARQPRAR